MDEFASLDATAQAELVRRGEVTPTELVEAAIARIEALNPALNCVVTGTFERARDRARTVAGRRPLAGVPYLLKDLGLSVVKLFGPADRRADSSDRGNTRVVRELRWQVAEGRVRRRRPTRRSAT